MATFITKQNTKIFRQILLGNLIAVLVIASLFLTTASRDSVKDQFLFYVGLTSFLSAALNLIIGILLLFKKNKSYSICFLITAPILFLIGVISFSNAHINWGF